MWQAYFAQVLGDSFEAAKKRNARISLRNFSQRLDVAPGMFSEIVRGRRHVSWDRATKIAERAKLEPKVLERLQDLQKKAEQNRPRVILQEDAVDLIMNPLYYKVLCAFEILVPPVKTADLATFLGAENEKIEGVMSRLMNLGLVNRDGEAYVWTGSHMSTPPNITSEKVQAFFREDLKTAIDGVGVAPAQREYTTITFAGNASELVNAKKRIREFRDDLSDSMHVEPNQIYQLSIQLRPVSKVFERGETK